MKIGFPLSKSGERKLADDFHGSKWIGSYDLATKAMTEVAISDVETQSEETDLFSVLKSLGIRLVVCNKMKPMALKYFTDQQITVYKAQGSLVDLNAELLVDGQLARFMPQMAEASGCSSCSSSSDGSCSSSSCSTDPEEMYF